MNAIQLIYVYRWNMERSRTVSSPEDKTKHLNNANWCLDNLRKMDIEIK